MRRAAVTAGTGGTGLETAVGLAKAGYAVTVVGRNAERGPQAVERLNGPGESARFLQADLGSLDEVRELAARIAAEGELTVLVNNIGAMFADRTDLGGAEASFVVNHLSPALLTELLLPALRAGAPSRVVNVTTGAVTLAKKVFDQVEPPGGTTASTGTDAPSSRTSPTHSTSRSGSREAGCRCSRRIREGPPPT
ncbi:short subunit dehydrogenase [Lentzea atacamensis]|uniref:Short subunit dehydrogenase n=1 Tax=Lentzea atacamensis TaxID=531938 RepID=A0A316I408_9PSEU|nr:SDR family NAD(P)-dependent oxidoreductase [Lentzea atacamensis]PWK87394.1 short subunit dehydrogenase [Lentzea atacamensis]